MNTNRRLGAGGAVGLTARQAEESDAALVARMLRGDQRAWGAFATRFDPLVKLAIRRVLSRFPDVPRADADETYAALMSSLFLRDMQKLRSFDFTRGRPLKAWLAVLATRAAWDQLRRAKRHNTMMSGMEAGEGRAPGGDAMTALIVREDCQRLGAIRAQLTARDQEFFDIMYIQEASADEVAAALRVSIKTVYTKHYKVRTRVALELQRTSLRGRGPGRSSARALSPSC